MILALYIGLLLFGLQGIILMGMNNKFRELKVAEERIIKLLMRSKLRR